MAIASGTLVKVADEVWIATALLHREHPDQSDFEIEEIMRRAAKEAGTTASVRASTFTSFSTASPTARPILDATACWLRPRRDDAGYSGSVIPIILRAKGRRRSRREKIFRKSIASC